MKINKTNVARLRDKAKVAYQLVPYEVDENDLSATHVADQLGAVSYTHLKRPNILKESVMATPMMMKTMTMITLPAGSLPAPLPELALHNQNHQTTDRKSTRLNSSHSDRSRMPSSA